MESDQLLKGKDVARLLNVSVALAFRLLKTGEITAIRFGRSVRVRAEDLETFILTHTNIGQIKEPEKNGGSLE